MTYDTYHVANYINIIVHITSFADELEMFIYIGALGQR